MFDIHHNTTNNYQKNDKVSKDEFVEFYRTLGPNYDEDQNFINMVKGVWNVKEEVLDNAVRSSAGGKDDATNHRDRYQKMNNKGTPFGVTGSDSSQQWETSNSKQA